MTITDPFARETAIQAHRRATDAQARAQAAEQTAEALRDLIPRRPTTFVGFCALCGERCKPNARYCRSHEWAL